MDPQRIGLTGQPSSGRNTRRPGAAFWIGGVFLVLLALLLLALIGGLFYRRHIAASAPTLVSASGPAQGTRGRITAVTATSITINSRRSGAHTFTLTPSTVITLDGQPSAVSGLAVGLGARVTSPDGATATEVALRTRRARWNGGAGMWGGGGSPGASP